MPSDAAAEPPLGRQAWLLLASLYGTQFLGLMFFVVALVAILREGGASLGTIGLVYMLGMIWPLKILWAPFVDRFGFGRIGHYRGWLLLSQGLLVAVLLLVGQFDVVQDFPAVFALSMIVALAASTQDIALDALACRLLPAGQRGIGNGLQIAGGLFGNLFGAGALLMAYPWLGWRGCTLALAVATSVSFFQLLWFREPVWPRTATRTGVLFRRFVRFWRGKGGAGWVAMLLFYTSGSAMAYATITPVLVDAGWDIARIGLAVNVCGSLLGIVSALVTGGAIRQLGLRRSAILAALLQAGGVLALTWPLLGHRGTWEVAVSVGLYFLLYNPAATVLAALMMERASPDHPGTDYTLQFSLSQFCAMSATALGAGLAAASGYLAALAGAFAVTIIGLLLALRWHPMRQERSPIASNAVKVG